MENNLTEMKKHSNDFQTFVNLVKIDCIKGETDINNLKDHFDKLKQDICNHFHKNDDLSEIETFKDLKERYYYYVDEKSKVDEKAAAEDEQRAQNIANPSVKVEIGAESVFNIITEGDKTIIKTPSEDFSYNKLYELSTKDGFTTKDDFKVYGLSSDGGEEISGLLIMKGDKPVCFQSSVLNADRLRDVNSCIEKDGAWIEYYHKTSAISIYNVDRINDDGVRSDLEIANLLKKALDRVVASEKYEHRWHVEDGKFPAFFGPKSSTIFNEVIEKPSSVIIQATAEAVAKAEAAATAQAIHDSVFQQIPQEARGDDSFCIKSNDNKDSLYVIYDKNSENRVVGYVYVPENDSGKMQYIFSFPENQNPGASQHSVHYKFPDGMEGQYKTTPTVMDLTGDDDGAKKAEENNLAALLAQKFTLDASFISTAPDQYDQNNPHGNISRLVFGVKSTPSAHPSVCGCETTSFIQKVH